MQKTLLTLAALVILVTAQTQTKTVVFTGKISHPNSDSLELFNDNGKSLASIKLDKKGNFKKEVEVEKGFYSLNDGTESLEIYLEPGFALNITLDCKRFDESVKYAGLGSSENNYKAAKYLLEESLEDKTNYMYYAALNEAGFLSLCDSLQQLQLALLQKHQANFHSDYAYIARSQIKYTTLKMVIDYTEYHAWVAKLDSFQPSSNFPDPFQDINVNDTKLIAVYEYSDYLRSYIESKVNIKLKADKDLDYYLTYLSVLNTELKNREIIEEQALPVLRYGFVYSKDIDQIYFGLRKVLIKEENINQMEETYAKMKKLLPGNKSPGFELKDKDGKTVKLDDFKGKLVYIDVWATWCGPCISELPHLARLQDSFKNENIVFLSICIFDEESLWREFLLKKKLEGIQLFAPDSKISFITDYVIIGVPRFILLDEQGNILLSKATRPSVNMVYEEIRTALKKAE